MNQTRIQILAFCALILLICLAGPLIGVMHTYHIDPSVLEIWIGILAVITAILYAGRAHFGGFIANLRTRMSSMEEEVIDEYPALPPGTPLLEYEDVYVREESATVTTQADEMETRQEREPQGFEPTLQLADNCALPWFSALNHTLIYEQPGAGRAQRSVATRLYIEQLGQYSMPMLIVTHNTSYVSVLPLLPVGWIAGAPESKDEYLSRAAHFVRYSATGLPVSLGKGYASVTSQNARGFGRRLLSIGAQVVLDLSTYSDSEQAALVLSRTLTGMHEQNTANQATGIVFLTEADLWLPNNRMLSRGNAPTKDTTIATRIREQIYQMTEPDRDGLYTYLTTDNLLSMDLRSVRRCNLWLLNQEPEEEDLPFICHHTGLSYQDLSCLQTNAILADITTQTAMETRLHLQRSLHRVVALDNTGRETTEPLNNAYDLNQIEIELEAERLGKTMAEGGDGEVERVAQEEQMTPPSASSNRKSFTRQQIAFALALQREGQLTQTALKRAPTTKTVGNTPTTFADLAQELGLKHPWSDKDMLWNERAKLLLEVVAGLSSDEQSEYEQEADMALAAIAERRGYHEDAARRQVGPHTPSRWELPEIGLLKVPEMLKTDGWHEVSAKARLLQETLNGFGVAVQVLEEYIKVGPRVIRFGILPTGIGEKKTKVEHITRLKKDLQRVLQAKTIRILDPVPGTPYVGIEIPNPIISTVRLREVLEDRDFLIARSKSRLTVALGKDVAGKVRCFDLRKAPHVLIGGTTGSGKSVCVNTILVSLLMGATPEDVRFALVDPKKVELPFYNKIPHLLGPVITKMDDVAPMLQSALEEMNQRYEVFAHLGVRDLDEYNKLRARDASLKNIPAHVILIDELASVMLAVKDGVPVKNVVEPLLCDLIALGRAAGVHLILATQRPVVDVVTGNIKAQLPTRIGFMVPQAIDSRVVLDQPGAEALLGKGDLLFLDENIAIAERIQCALTETEEARAVTEYWKQTLPLTGEPGIATLDIARIRQFPLPQQTLSEASVPLTSLDGEVQRLQAEAREEDDDGESDATDPLLADAIAFVRTRGEASISMLQRRFRIGYSRAATLIEQMEEIGIIGESVRGGRRRPVISIPSSDVRGDGDPDDQDEQGELQEGDALPSIHEADEQDELLQR